MILIYTPKITNRLKFIFNVIFHDILDANYLITDNLEEFNDYPNVKINYSTEKINDEIFFYPKEILFEKGIRQQNIQCFDFENSKAFFQVYRDSDLPFDPFAASFYLITRYEEYLPYLEDKYERFEANQSLAFKHGFLNKPLVNIWAEKIKQIIITKYPNYKFPKKNYEYIATIDIDNAYAYKLKGFIRTIGGYLKSLKNLDFQEFTDRTKIISGFKNDPFDTYNIFIDLQKKYDLKPIFFILFADYGLNDKNIHVQNKNFHSLIKSIGDYAEVGIHPSYASNSIPSKLKSEIELLNKVLNKEVKKSRQHFLRLHFPHTYRNLIDNDITDDYTMGYASHIGFRASICSTYSFYDLDLEDETNLRIHPFAVMDGTLRDYMKVSSFDAVQVMKPIIDEIKQVNGTFISLWHNETLSNMKRWIGWQKVYEDMIKIAVYND